MQIDYSNWNEINEMIIRYKQKWAVYIINNLRYSKEDELIWELILIRCADYEDLITKKDIENIRYGGLFLFNSKEDMEIFFNIFNTPPVLQSNIYAIPYDNQGNSLLKNAHIVKERVMFNF